jgi:hypothetical protein
MEHGIILLEAMRAINHLKGRNFGDETLGTGENFRDVGSQSAGENFRDVGSQSALRLTDISGIR